MKVTLDDLTKAKAGIVATARRHRAANVRVFGSVARGEAGPASDVDLLVDLERGATYFDLVDLEESLGRLIGSKVQVVSSDGLSPHLRSDILAEARPL